MGEFTAKVGPVLGRLLTWLTYAIVAGAFFLIGATYYKLDIEESTGERLQIDSRVAQTETDITNERKAVIDEWLKNNDPVMPDGSPNPEWLQLMANERAIARGRGDQTSLVRKATQLFTGEP